MNVHKVINDKKPEVQSIRYKATRKYVVYI